MKVEQLLTLALSSTAFFTANNVYTVQCSFDTVVQCTVDAVHAVHSAQCTVIRQSIVPLRWASVPLRWAQQRVKRSSHPQRCRWWSRQTRWPWRWFPDLFGVVALAYCVKADDDNDGVTLKDYEVEESGEYADCYHKTTQNCTFHFVLWCTMRSCDLLDVWNVFLTCDLAMWLPCLSYSRYVVWYTLYNLLCGTYIR